MSKLISDVGDRDSGLTKDVLQLRESITEGTKELSDEVSRVEQEIEVIKGDRETLTEGINELESKLLEQVDSLDKLKKDSEELQKEIEDENNGALGLSNRIQSLESNMGDDSKGLVKSVSDIIDTLNNDKSGIVKRVNDIELDIVSKYESLELSINEVKDRNTELNNKIYPIDNDNINKDSKEVVKVLEDTTKILDSQRVSLREVLKEKAYKEIESMRVNQDTSDVKSYEIYSDEYITRDEYKQYVSDLEIELENSKRELSKSTNSNKSISLVLSIVLIVISLIVGIVICYIVIHCCCNNSDKDDRNRDIHNDNIVMNMDMKDIDDEYKEDMSLSDSYDEDSVDVNSELKMMNDREIELQRYNGIDGDVYTNSDDDVNRDIVYRDVYNELSVDSVYTSVPYTKSINIVKYSLGDVIYNSKIRSLVNPLRYICNVSYKICNTCIYLLSNNSNLDILKKLCTYNIVMNDISDSSIDDVYISDIPYEIEIYTCDDSRVLYRDILKRYMYREVLDSDVSEISTYDWNVSIVHSIVCMIYEVLTMKIPYSDISIESVSDYIESGHVLDITDINSIDSKLYELMCQALDVNSNVHSSIELLMNGIRSIIDSIDTDIVSDDNRDNDDSDIDV